MFISFPNVCTVMIKALDFNEFCRLSIEIHAVDFDNRTYLTHNHEETKNLDDRKYIRWEKHMGDIHSIRDWILLVCFSWRYEATEGPRVNFIMREALFRNLHVDPLSLHTSMRNKQVEFNPYIYTLSNLYRLATKYPGGGFIQNTRSLFYGRHYSSLHRLMSLHGKLKVKIFLMFIVAENTRSVNICWLRVKFGEGVYDLDRGRSWWQKKKKHKPKQRNRRDGTWRNVEIRGGCSADF